MAASKEDLRYLVENDKSGSRAQARVTGAGVMSEGREQIIRDFNERVNMTPRELERWLATEKSQNSGVTEQGKETKGHESGRWILALLRKNKRDYSDDDISQMRRVRAYINRNLAQRPSGDVADTTWR